MIIHYSFTAISYIILTFSSIAFVYSLGLWLNFGACTPKFQYIVKFKNFIISRRYLLIVAILEVGLLILLTQLMASYALLDTLSPGDQIEVNMSKALFTLIANNTMALVIYLGVYSIVISLLFVLARKVFIYFLNLKNEKRTLTELINEKYVTLLSKFNRTKQDPAYLALKEFWTHDFFLRKKESFGLFFFEVPLLYLLSFFTFMRIRLYWLQTLIIFRGLFIAAYWQDFSLLLGYIGTTFLLTLLLLIPPVNIHIKDMYGDSSLRKVGWNALTDNFFSQIKPVVEFLVVSVAAGTGYKGLVMGDDYLSHQLNEASKQQTHQAWIDAAHRCAEANILLKQANQELLPMPSYPVEQMEILGKRRVIPSVDEIVANSEKATKQATKWIGIFRGWK